MTKVFKTTYKVVVLSSKQPVHGGAAIEDVLREMDNGEYIGQVILEGSVRVPVKKVRAELIDLGNDGTFFNED